MKNATISLLAIMVAGCAHGRFVLSPPLEQSPPNDVLYFGVGIGLGSSLQLTKVKPLFRVPLALGTCTTIRYTTILDRPTDSGFMCAVGWIASEIVGFWIKRELR